MSVGMILDDGQLGLTLCIEEVLNRDIVVIIDVDSGVLEDVFCLGVHELLAVLVTEGPDMVPDACGLKLLVERDLLKLHVMDTSCC